jgi:hypothetical protein
MMTVVRQAEYTWLDGDTPTQRLRSKTRIVAFPENEPVTLAAFPTRSRWRQDSGDDKGPGGKPAARPFRFHTNPTAIPATTTFTKGDRETQQAAVK